MVNRDNLEEYSNSIRRLRKECIDAGLNEDEFKKLYFDSLKSVNKRSKTETRQVFIKYLIFGLGIVIVLCAVYNVKPMYTCIASNIQEYIYPGLRLFRHMFIPFISLFPSLTEFYHETCLIQNPFFTVVDMDCWPCSIVHNIREVYDPKPVNQQQNAPFFYKTEQVPIDMVTLSDLFSKHKDIFTRDGSKVLTNNKYYTSATEMFNKQHLDEKNFYTWKFNNINIAKILRQIIPRPKVVPKFGQSTERFIIVDTSQNKHRIPDTECSFSFLLSLNGVRTIDLVPAEECKHQCKTLKVELRESYLLWYNWWYWRPVMQPSNGNNTFIAHVGSYC